MKQIISARDLHVIWEGEECPGISFYALRQDLNQEPTFPIDLWNELFAHKHLLLFGEGWKVDLWDCRVNLSKAPWQDLCEQTLEVLVRNGSRVAWIGLGELFVDPPELFNPVFMSGGVMIAVARSGLKFLKRKGGGFEPLTDDEMILLFKSLRFTT